MTEKQRWAKVAKQNGIEPKQFSARVCVGWSYERAATTPVKRKEYALYRGDELLVVGTVPEIAEHQNICEYTVRLFMTPSYAKVTTDNAKRLVCLDGE